MTTPHATVPVLDYAVVRRRRGRWWWWAACVCVLFLLTGTGWWCWRKFTASRSSAMSVGRNLAMFSIAPETVVFEEDATMSAALLQQGRPYRLMSPGYHREPWESWTGKPVEYAHDALKEVPFPVMLEVSPPENVVFLHERITPSGKSCLVHVVCGLSLSTLPASPGTREFHLFAHLYRASPGRGFWHDRTVGFLGDGTSIALNPDERLRLYAGQPDASDPAHFTIRYMLGGKPGLIDARMLDLPAAKNVPNFGELPPRPGIRLDIRNGPLLRPRSGP